MVQILPNRSVGAQLAKGLSDSLPDALSKYVERKKEEEKLGKKNKQIEDENDLVGIPKGLRTEKLRELSYKDKLEDEALNSIFNGLTSKSNTPKEEPNLFSSKESENQNEKNFYDDLTPEKLTYLAHKKPQVASQIQKMKEQDQKRQQDSLDRKTKQENRIEDLQREDKKILDDRTSKKFESDRDFNFKQVEPVLKESDAILRSAPQINGLLNQMESDAKNGDVDSFTQFAVNATGFEPWRSPEASRFRAAGKEFFVNSLGALAPGARPNQFIEQQLVSAQPAIGRSKEGNLSNISMMKYIENLKVKRANLIRQFQKEDQQTVGYPKADIASRVDEAMVPYAEGRQKELSYDIRKIHEDQLKDEDLAKELVLGGVPKGTTLTLRMARILMIKNKDDEKAAAREAKKLGFTIPDQKLYGKDVE